MSDPVLLFDRTYRLVVNTLEIRELAVAFKIDRNLKPEPNKAEIHVKNLTKAHRSELEQMGGAVVQLEAGYTGGSSVLFLGDLRNISSVRDGPDIVTTIASGDGEVAYQKARVAVSVRKNTPTDQVIKALATALGVNQGNLAKAVGSIQGAGLGSMFSLGTVLSGSAAREMTNVCRSVGLLWSIQNGKLQIVPLKQALAGEALLVSPKTGLVGSPTVDGKKKTLKCQMLMAPDVFPGRLMVLDSESHKGQYRIEETSHNGDFYGPNWYIELVGKRY